MTPSLTFLPPATPLRNYFRLCVFVKNNLHAAIVYLPEGMADIANIPHFLLNLLIVGIMLKSKYSQRGKYNQNFQKSVGTN
jgi:hypothetical protein